MLGECGGGVRGKCVRVKRNHQEELIRTGKFQPAALTLSVRPWFCLRCVGEAEPQTRQRMIDSCPGYLSERLPESGKIFYICWRYFFQSSLVSCDNYIFFECCWQSCTADIHNATKIPIIYSHKRNCAASVPVSTFMYPHISWRRIGRPIVGIYKSLTDTWMWK